MGYLAGRREYTLSNTCVHAIMSSDTDSIPGGSSMQLELERIRSLDPACRCSSPTSTTLSTTNALPPPDISTKCANDRLQGLPPPSQCPHKTQNLDNSGEKGLKTVFSWTMKLNSGLSYLMNRSLNNFSAQSLVFLLLLILKVSFNNFILISVDYQMIILNRSKR